MLDQWGRSGGILRQLSISFTLKLGGSDLRRFSASSCPMEMAMVPNSDFPSLHQFLHDSKAQFLLEPSKFIVVVGNEAGDLDSVSSAIAFAWFQHTIEKQLIVPLIQIEHDDIPLRPENLYALKSAGITQPQSHLLCLTDLKAFKSFPALTFSLVDHNRLGSAFHPENETAVVNAVIDHHTDEGLYESSAKPRIIEPVGSCASLIVRHFGPKTPFIPPEIATLLLSAILLDTGGLRPGGKAVDVDIQAVAFLLPHLMPPRLTQDPSLDLLPDDSSLLHDLTVVKNLSSCLSELKSDISSLSIRDQLRRDYKQYRYSFQSSGEPSPMNIGLATVPLRLNSWARTDDMIDQATSFMRDKLLTVLGILTTYKSKKGKHKREMLWLFLEEAGEGFVEPLVARLLDGLESNEDLLVRQHPSFQLDSKAFPIQWRAYRQQKAKATRKMVAPLVQSIVEGRNDTKSISI